jgi:hypothetical protein
MMTMKALVFTLALLLLTGCAPTVTPYSGQKQVVRSYELGQPLSTVVGRPILVVRSTSAAPVYVVTRDYAPPQHDAWKGGLDYPPLTKGMEFTKVADRSDGLIGISNPDYVISIPGGMIRKEKREAVTIWISPSGVVSKTMEGPPWVQEPLFSQAKDEATGGSAYGAELVYNGFAENRVQALYRERLSGMASETPATPLQFSLNDGKTFAFKSIQIEVLSANSDSLRYRIVSDDNLPWVQ